MPFFRLRKISKKPAASTSGASTSQLTSLESTVSQIEAKLSDVEDDLETNEIDDTALLTRVTSLESSQGSQDTEIAALTKALNSAGSSRKYLVPKAATCTVTPAGDITTTSTLFTLYNGHTSGDDWKIEFYHLTYTSGAWSSAASFSAPALTTFSVRAVKISDGSILSASSLPRFLTWTGPITSSATSNSGFSTCRLGTSDATLGASVALSNGDAFTYAVIDDAAAGVFSPGTYSGKVTVTISGWTQTYGSGAPVDDAFYRLDSWWNNNHGGDTTDYKSYHPASKHNYKLQMNWGNEGQTANSFWDYPLGDGANNGDNGYPQINWAPATAPTSASEETAIIGLSTNRTSPAQGTNEYTFTLDLSDSDKVGNSTTSVKLGFRAYAGYQSSGWAQGMGQYWISIEPVAGEGTWTPPA